MDDLPHDILAHIFLCTPLRPKHKLAICAVSRRLRRAALGTALLWSSITIGGSRDLGYFELCLSHSRHALLSVHIVPYGHSLALDLRMSPRPFDADRIVAALLPHAARLRSLTVYLHKLPPLAPLLSAGLILQHLEKLVVHGSPMTGHFHVSLSAPQLQVVDVSSDHVQDLFALAPHPRDLTMALGFSMDIQEFMAQLVSNISQTLRRLALYQSLHDLNSSPLVGPWVFPKLQYLHLFCRSSRAVEMLRCVPASHIPHVRVGLTDRIDYEENFATIVYPALAELLVGVENIAEFSVWGRSECCIVSSSGQRRALSSETHKALYHIWTYLCEHFDARVTVTSCRLSKAMLWLHQFAFAGRPPAGPEFTLYAKACFSRGWSGTLKLPTLAKVALLGNATDVPGTWSGSPLRLDEHKNLVFCLACGAVNCDRTDVELCTCDVSRLTERGTELALREWVLQESEHGGSLTADAGCVIRWILCSGNCVKA